MQIEHRCSGMIAAVAGEWRRVQHNSDNTEKVTQAESLSTKQYHSTANEVGETVTGLTIPQNLCKLLVLWVVVSGECPLLMCAYISNQWL